MIAASELLQNIYISTVVNTVDLYIYICKKYIHTLFSYVIYDIFYLYTFFDVIVFNMLNYMYVCVYKEYWPLVSFLVYKCSRLLRKVPVDSTCIFLSSLDGVFVDAEY